MRLRDWTISFLCVLIAAGLFFAAGSRLDPINDKRVEMNLVSNEPLENAPPSLAFATVAMGAFRGLVVDVLWIRADMMKEKGMFFDAKQLADWITVLQPRFVTVWDFQSWNMAYNISVAIPATQPQERWRWVKNGYELLRDKGIPLNPNAITLYHRLAWIFQHKMGGVTDDAHRFYKLQLAMAMQSLLGENPDKDLFEALAKSPLTVEELLQDEKQKKFIDDLAQVSDEFSENENIVSTYLGLRENPEKYDPNIFNVLDDYRNENFDVIKKFDTFARSYQLRNTWKMEPEVMSQCNDLYGPMVDGDPNDPNSHLPLNWRHPDAHAIYWAHKGLQVAGQDPTETDVLNTDRIIFHSLQSLYRTGRIFIYNEPIEVERKEFTGEGPETVQMVRPIIYLRPDNRMFDAYNQHTLKVMKKYETVKRMRQESIRNGHRNMLKNAVLSFYQAGNEKKAREIYNQLRQMYGEREELQQSLVEFCRARLKEELESLGITDAREIILTMLSESYFRYAMGDDEQAMGRENMAKEVYDNYQKEFASETADGVNRAELPQWSMVRFMALLDFIYDPMYPQSMRDLLLNRIQVERPKLYEQLQQRGKEFQEQMEQNQQQQEN